MYTTYNYSPNFEFKKRKPNQIKFIIFHYTGMKRESEAIKRLTNIKSKVSSHYLIKNNGEIVVMVPDLYEAWHAGISYWKNFKSLNKSSIGIEISNPGHNLNYKKFSKKQIKSLKDLSKFLIRKYKIDKKNILGHSDIAPLRKLDPGEKFPWKRLSKYKLGNWYEGRGKKLKFTDYKKIESLFFNNLFKIGYRYFIVTKRTKNDRLVIKSFQQHYLPHKVSGKIDQKTLEISHFLSNQLKLT